jgi:hypothetical protein
MLGETSTDGKCQGVYVRGLPDAPTSSLTDHGRLETIGKGDSMALIQVKVIEGVFPAPQKREIVERLTDAMVAIEGENMRRQIWCMIERGCQRRLGHERPPGYRR